MRGGTGRCGCHRGAAGRRHRRQVERRVSSELCRPRPMALARVTLLSDCIGSALADMLGSAAAWLKRRVGERIGLPPTPSRARTARRASRRRRRRHRRPAELRDQRRRTRPPTSRPKSPPRPAGDRASARNRRRRRATRQVRPGRTDPSRAECRRLREARAAAGSDGAGPPPNPPSGSTEQTRVRSAKPHAGPLQARCETGESANGSAAAPPPLRMRPRRASRSRRS